MERPLPKLAYGFLPIAAIELDQFYFLFRNVEVIKTAHVYGIEVRSGAWPCENVDPAGRAKVVLCDHGSELISADSARTGHKSKVCGGDTMVKDALLCADGAVADRDAIDFRLDLEADSTAVATSVIFRHRSAL